MKTLDVITFIVNQNEQEGVSLRLKVVTEWCKIWLNILMKENILTLTTYESRVVRASMRLTVSR